MRGARAPSVDHRARSRPYGQFWKRPQICTWRSGFAHGHASPMSRIPTAEWSGFRTGVRGPDTRLRSCWV